MAKKRTAKCDVESLMLEAVHEIAMKLHDAGVMDEDSMERLDKTCLVPKAIASKKKNGLDFVA